jgi:hypothetical protein
MSVCMRVKRWGIIIKIQTWTKWNENIFIETGFHSTTAFFVPFKILALVHII